MPSPGRYTLSRSDVQNALRTLSWLLDTVAWPAPARMAENDADSWRAMLAAEDLQREDLRVQLWVTHALCRAAVAENGGAIGRALPVQMPGQPPSLDTHAYADSDDERIVRWLARTFNRWLQDGHMPRVVLQSRSPQFRYQVYSEPIAI